MRLTRVLMIILISVVFASPQTNERTVLTGTVLDASGAVIVGAKVTATNKSREKFDARTDNSGVYVLELPFNKYTPSDRRFKIASYDIEVDAHGFERSLISNFKLAPEKMRLDFALDVLVIIDKIEVPAN